MTMFGEGVVDERVIEVRFEPGCQFAGRVECWSHSPSCLKSKEKLLAVSVSLAAMWLDSTSLRGFLGLRLNWKRLDGLRRTAIKRELTTFESGGNLIFMISQNIWVRKAYILLWESDIGRMKKENMKKINKNSKNAITTTICHVIRLLRGHGN